jgi:hypothetical protein
MVDGTAPRDWPCQVAKPLNRYIVGVDLGQSVDPTAICVLHHQVTPLANDFEPFPNQQMWKQKKTEFFDVEWLERLPLGMRYPEQMQRVRAVMNLPPLDNADTRLVLDYTGVGRAAADCAFDIGLRPWLVTTTAGNNVTKHNGKEFHVPKGVLVSNFQARLHREELRFSDKLKETLGEEMEKYQRRVTDAGRVTYNAASGFHDDQVSSISIALFLAIELAKGGEGSMNLDDAFRTGVVKRFAP